MKRAARHKTGSVVFDKRRKTWNFLWWKDGKRRSKLIGTLKEFRTKGAAQRQAQSFQPDVFGQSIGKSKPQWKLRLTQCELWQQGTSGSGCLHAIPRRGCIVPGFGTTFCRNGVTVLISEVQPRPIELWLRQLDLSPKSKSHVRGMLHLLMEFAMWSGALEISRNPIDLVVVKGATKRTRQPRSLTVDEFRKFIQHLEEPFRTMALLCVCFGLRISECLALKWCDVDWLNGKLRIERGIVRQQVDDVKTVYSQKRMSVDARAAGDPESVETDDSVSR